MGQEKYFTANGKRYTVTGSLSILRFERLELLQIEAGFDSSFETLYNGLAKAYGELDKGKIASASVTLHNLLGSVARNVSGRSHPVLTMCTLFINADGENAAEWSQELAESKIADWKAEGIPVGFFFQLCREYLKAFTGGSWENFLNTSAEGTEGENPTESFLPV